MEIFYEQFGQRVREARRRTPERLTQEGLAKRLSLTRTSITNIEKGYQGVPLHTFVELAKVLGVEPCSLLPDLQEAPTGTAVPEKVRKRMADMNKTEQSFVGRVIRG